MSKRITCDVCQKEIGTQMNYSFTLKQEDWMSLSTYKIHLCEKCYKNMIKFLEENTNENT